MIGRLPVNDIQLEHPSLSRYHAIIQYKAQASEDQPVGFYLYDLDSTHGTFHNKNRCFPKTYYHLRVGHGIKVNFVNLSFIIALLSAKYSQSKRHPYMLSS